MKLPYRLHDLNSLISEYAPTSPPHHRTQQTQPSTLYHCTITQRNPPLYTTSPYIYYSTNTCVPGLRLGFYRIKYFTIAIVSSKLYTWPSP